MAFPKLHISKISPDFVYKDKTYIWHIEAYLPQAKQTLILKDREALKGIEKLEGKDISAYLSVIEARFSKADNGGIQGVYRKDKYFFSYFPELDAQYNQYKKSEYGGIDDNDECNAFDKLVKKQFNTLWDNKKFMDTWDRANIFETADGILVIDRTYKNETLIDGETYYMLPETVQIFAFNNLHKKPAKAVDMALYTLSGKEPLPVAMHPYLDAIIQSKQEAFYIDLDKVQKTVTAIRDSKLYGNPYFPKNMEYPTYGKNKTPMRLLAQINMEDLPKQFHTLPTKGLLQIFMTLDFNTFYDPGKGDYKVIFHTNTDLPDTELINDFSFVTEAEENIDGDTWYRAEEECKISFIAEDEYIGYADYAYNKRFTKKARDVFEDEMDYITDNFCVRGSKMGGYSENTQGQDYRKKGQHEVLLFQLADVGDIANFDMDLQFFIDKNDLAKLDFIDTLLVTSFD